MRLTPIGAEVYEVTNRRPHRTPAQTIEYLREQRRLAAADIDHGKIRVAAIDRAIEAIRTGGGVPACDLERDRTADDELRDGAA